MSWYESKLILGHKAFKAVLQRDNQVTAWFTPNIPASHGPSGYGGLPGIILHLSTDKYEFAATEIRIPGLSQTNRYDGIEGKPIEMMSAAEWEQWIDRNKYELLVD